MGPSSIAALSALGSLIDLVPGGVGLVWLRFVGFFVGVC